MALECTTSPGANSLGRATEEYGYGLGQEIQRGPARPTHKIEGLFSCTKAQDKVGSIKTYDFLGGVR